MRPEPIAIPAELPDYARDYLAQIDRAVCASLDVCPPRYTGDPRKWIAGTMYNHPDINGTMKLMLHTYLELLDEKSPNIPTKVERIAAIPSRTP